MIDRGSPTPPWEQLYGLLRARIESGEMPSGSRVPAILRLAQEHEVAPGTARKALDRLRAEGLIETRAGWGTFVKAR